MTASPTPEARRTPRVAYHAAVELLAQTDDDDAPRALPAETLDLGEGGMRVAVAERIPIGAPLTCKLTLDGRETALSGYVVWLRSHTSPRPHGMGIRFDEVPGYEQRLLAHVVERTSAGYRPVELQFEGAEAPIVARALTHATGLTLSAPLPILDRDAGVDVRFDEHGEPLRGRVAEVRVVEADKHRRLEVEVALVDANGARFRREARFASAGGMWRAPRRSEAGRVTSQTEAPRSRRRLARTAAALASFALGMAGGFFVSPWMPGWQHALDLGPIRDASDAAGAARATRTSPSAVVGGRATARTRLDVRRPRPAPAPAVDPGSVPAESPAAAASTPRHAAPQVSVEGVTTVLRLPFSGSLEGMVARTWANPAVLALDLPVGRVELAPGAHALHAGSVAGLRINVRGGASLLRIRLSQPIGRYAVSAHEGMLELRVMPAP